MDPWILNYFSWTGLSCWPQTQLPCPAYSYNFQTRLYSFSFASIPVFHPHLDQVHLPTGTGKSWRVQLSGTTSPTWELIFRHLCRLTSIVLFLSFHLFVCSTSLGHVWWHIPIFATLGKLRLKNYKFKRDVATEEIKGPLQQLSKTLSPNDKWKGTGTLVQW